MPLPSTRCGGRPVSFSVTYVITSTGFVTSRNTAFGATFSSCGTSLRQISAFAVGEIHPRLPRLLLRAGGDDDDVGIRADADVVRPFHRRHRHELQAVVEVEHLGVDLCAVHVEQRDLLPDAADQARVRDRRADRPGADDRDLRCRFVSAMRRDSTAVAAQPAGWTRAGLRDTSHEDRHATLHKPLRYKE